MQLRLSATLLLVVSLAVPANAFGHGNRPLSEQVYAVGEDASDWFLRTNFGAITSENPRRYVCEEAFTSEESFRFLPLTTSEWLAVGAKRAMRTEDGCNFEKVAEFSESVAAAAVDVESRRAALATVADEGPLHVSVDGGTEFAPVEADLSDSPSSFTGLGFVDSSQLVATARASGEANPPRMLQFEVPSDADDSADAGSGTTLEASFELAGVFPELLHIDEELVVWTAERDDAPFVAFGPPDAPMKHRLDVEVRPADAAVGQQSGELWVASPWSTEGESGGRGFARTDPKADAPEWERVLENHSGSCVAAVGDGLLVCGHRLRDDYDLGRVTGDDDVETVAHFQELRGPLECGDDTDTASVCPSIWPELARSLDIDDPHSDHDDAGPANSGACSASPSGLPLPSLLTIVGLLTCALGRRIRGCETSSPPTTDQKHDS